MSGHQGSFHEVSLFRPHLVSRTCRPSWQGFPQHFWRDTHDPQLKTLALKAVTGHDAAVRGGRS